MDLGQAEGIGEVLLAPGVPLRLQWIGRKSVTLAIDEEGWRVTRRPETGRVLVTRAAGPLARERAGA